jgi:hypothetical protein
MTDERFMGPTETPQGEKGPETLKFTGPWIGLSHVIP